MIYFKCWKEKNLQPRIHYLARLSFKLGVLMSFPDKQKLRNLLNQPYKKC